jgi:RimJ/RimL family protein N-acetyltransferase
MTTLQLGSLEFRPFEDRDADAFAEAARESVATVQPWMPWCTTGYSAADALDWFGLARAGAVAGSAHEFGLFSREDGAFVGGAGLNQVNALHRLCNLGYWIRQSRQGRGHALAAVQALSRHAFDELGLHRVEIVVAQGNLPSAAVARRAGASFECVARNRLYIHGRPVPALVFSLIPPAAGDQAGQPV